LIFLFAGAVNAFIAVAMGSFAAHALDSHLDRLMMEVFKIGAEYQLAHALALIAVSFLLKFWPKQKLLMISGWAFLAGTILFPFSLYALALTGVGTLGAITPLGGVAFLVGWVCLAIFALLNIKE
jgi:uncharacterized membrane protein YgdD (TMEM256/DUF423 family)|tara:strand:- start:56677 stop:57051 length:375 start_codon:yes stop_codon:yes gene_type:complete